MDDDLVERSSPNLQHLPGGQISYLGKPTTSLQIGMNYPFNNISPELTQLYGTHHNRHLSLKAKRQPPSKLYSLNLLDEPESDSEEEPTPNRTPSQRVSSYIDEIINTPEMEQVEAETKKIRADANALLAKLQSEPKLSSSKLYTTYDFSKLYKGPGRLEARESCDYFHFDEDEGHYRCRPVRSNRFEPGRRVGEEGASESAVRGQSYGELGTRGQYEPPTRTPYDPLPPRRPTKPHFNPYDWTSTYTGPDSTKSAYDDYEPLIKTKPINTYESLASTNYYNNYYSPRLPDYKYHFDTNSDIKNNIAIKAQYASNRLREGGEGGGGGRRKVE